MRINSAYIALLVIMMTCMLTEAAVAELSQVAPNLYFNYDRGGSNSVVLITDEGVLLVDSRMHPDDAERLLADIRELTDAPIRYVANSQFHGDHYMGNVVFQREGATFIAHQDTQAVIKERFQFEVENRPFAARGQDPDEVVLVLPDILFDSRMTLSLGGLNVELIKGMGGAMDLVAGADNIIVTMTHTSKSGQSKLLSNCTLPLTRKGCIKRVLTDPAFLDIEDGKFILRERSPGVSVEEIVGLTAGELLIPDDVPEMVL